MTLHLHLYLLLPWLSCSECVSLSQWASVLPSWWPSPVSASESLNFNYFHFRPKYWAADTQSGCRPAANIKGPKTSNWIVKCILTSSSAGLGDYTWSVLVLAPVMPRPPQAPQQWHSVMSILPWILWAVLSTAESETLNSSSLPPPQKLTVLNLNFWGLGWPWGSDKDVR